LSFDEIQKTYITDNDLGAKAAFTQECHAAGVKVNFVEPAVHLDMVRRADGGSSSADSSHAGMAGMAGMGSGAGAESAAATATPTVARPAKADASASGARTSGARASGARASATSKGVKPASFTGAAVPREVAGSMFGFVAAVAAAAAI
jgi:hypothetical protein